MAKLYFIGGENVAKRGAKNVNAQAFEDAGGTPDVLVFPWARASFDVKYKRRKRFTDYLKSLGADEVEFSEYSDSPENITAKAAHADLIYLTGGQVSVLVSRLKAKGVDNLLRNFRGVVVGRSAGAMALGKRCLVTNRYSRTRKTVEGLGLVDFSVKAHYLPAQEALLRKLSSKEKVYAIPQNSALVFDPQTYAVAVVGEVFLFENGEKNAVSET